MTGRAARRLANRSTGQPRYAVALTLTRGRCRGRPWGRGRRHCESRYAYTRVSIDTRDTSRMDMLATLECVTCGATWRRVAVPASLTDATGALLVRVTLLVPAHVTRYMARGRWHRVGDDAATIPDADVSALIDAQADWRSRADRVAERKARLAERKAQEAREAHERTMALLTRLHERDAEAARLEAEAVAREAA